MATSKKKTATKKKQAGMTADQAIAYGCELIYWGMALKSKPLTRDGETDPPPPKPGNH